MDLPSRGGRAPGSQANGSFPKGTGRLSEKSPAGYPPPHHRDDTPRERGRPARMLSLRLPLSFPAMLQPTALPAGTASDRPRRAMASFPVDPGGEDGRGCARLCAGGTPALPGGLPPMTSSHPGHEIAEALWRRLWLKEVHLSSCLFVFIGVHSWFVFINDPPFFLE